MRRRIAKLEMSLTPKQIVLLWLKEAQEFPAFEQYLQNNAREPLVAAARVLVSNKVTKAVQATRHKLLSEEAVKKLTIEAKKEADFLVMLAFNINAQLLRESSVRAIEQR